MVNFDNCAAPAFDSYESAREFIRARCEEMEKSL